MILLTLGVLLFTLIHLYPCFAAAHRARMCERLGENRYKGLFSLLFNAEAILSALKIEKLF